jgi:pyridoxal phosphate enzyme (YggS family)
MSAVKIAQNIELVRQKVAARCLKNGIDPAGITIVGISKTHPAEAASMAVKAGLGDLGENRVQEAAAKIHLVRPIPIWHLVGHLQSNKARKAVELFDVIQSIDSLELAQVLSLEATKQGKQLTIYLQVNSSHEDQKSGLGLEEIWEVIGSILKLPGLNVAGLMTIGPLTDDVSKMEASFSATRKLYEELKKKIGAGFDKLSMGMSGDYELALDYGANVLRIGTAIFGDRGTV